VPLPHARLLQARKVYACLLAAGADRSGRAAAALNGSDAPVMAMEDYRKRLAGHGKLRRVREFLQRELPDYMVSETYDSDPETLAFIISTPSHSTLLKIRKYSSKDKNPRHWIDMLDRINIAYQFRQHPDVEAFVISCAPDRL
jgi:hypothetical protein